MPAAEPPVAGTAGFWPWNLTFARLGFLAVDVGISGLPVSASLEKSADDAPGSSQIVGQQ